MSSLCDAIAAAGSIQIAEGQGGAARATGGCEPARNILGGTRKKPNEVNGKLQLDALTRHAPGDELPIRELGKKGWLQRK